jgi:hypothetical protein
MSLRMLGMSLTFGAASSARRRIPRIGESFRGVFVAEVFVDFGD